MSELQKIVVGIRSSNLSKSQTNLLIQELLKQDSNLNESIFDIKTIKTTGDVHNTHRLDQIGGKGLFIKEIESPSYASWGMPLQIRLQRGGAAQWLINEVIRKARKRGERSAYRMSLVSASVASALGGGHNEVITSFTMSST